MTPQHTKLRISALYHARGMISQSEYRDFRREYLQAMIHGDELPELPDAWHHVPPGTHTMHEEDETPELEQAQPLSPRVIAVVIAIAIVAIGAFYVLTDLR